MAQDQRSQARTTLRGFASMDQEKQREIAAKGANVPNEKRSFAQDRALASGCGTQGRTLGCPAGSQLCQNRRLAAAAGRKGARMSKAAGTWAQCTVTELHTSTIPRCERPY